MSGMKEKLQEKFGRQISSRSMISHEVLIRELCKIVRPRKVLEIGTYRGLSAALFASQAEHVTTLDITREDTADEVWRFLGVKDKIKYLIAASNAEKRALIDKCDFDFAFIDGSHLARDAKLDFECVKRCGCVLFHDFKPDNARYRGLVRFIRSLEPAPIIFGPKHSRFALWVSPERKGTIKAERLSLPR